jgi:hypothetical protein
LRRTAVLRRLGREVDMTGPFASLAECLAAAPLGQDAAAVKSHSEAAHAMDRPDLLLLELPSLQEHQATELRQLAQAWGVAQAAVVCVYAMPSACDAARQAGFAVQRGPIGEEALADWLHWLSNPYAETPGRMAIERPARPEAAWAVPGTAAPRRFDDITLADMAALSSAVACECPRHVSELLMQLTAFETYSAQCAAQSTVEAELHRYLKHSAASARAILEVALERIALHEGLVLKA